ncbi:MAG: MFS transporter [Synechococcus sp. TMED155]|nr:MAG: MFS transporter [Synechococcus sp. TMED155]
MQAQAIPLRRVILAGLIGNVMEWYDFAIYGYFAAIIGSQFFPSSDPRNSLLAAFGAFAAGFLVRPLGGVVLGSVADRLGRQRALMVSVLAMAAATVLMAILPSYSRIGLAAPLLMVLLRILQGLSAGGEYSTSIVFLAEHAPAGRRGLVAIWGLWGSVLGILLGSGVGALLAAHLSEAQLSSWGWRIPFALGLLVAITGLLLRRGLQGGTPPPQSLSPLRHTLSRHRGAVLRVMLLNIASSVGFYTAFVYAVSYIETVDGMTVAFALELNTGVMGLLLMAFPLSAWLSDRIGRRPMLISGSALLLLGGVPIFLLLHSTTPALLRQADVLLMLAVALLAGGKNPANVELMPAAVRCTGLALAFNLAEGLFGGTTPLIASWLLTRFSNPLLPGVWLSLSGLITLVTVLWFTPETFKKTLETSP